jgi:GH25 family lysozyme M1 (1,4-beta-N-acetylmuramidase)
MPPDRQLPELQFQLNNRSATDLTLQAASYGTSSTPPQGTDAFPAAVAARTSFTSHNVASPASATYVDAGGNAIVVNVVSATPPTGWTTLKVSFNPGTSDAAFNATSALAPAKAPRTSATVDVYGVVRLRLTNTAQQDLVLTSTDHTPQPGTDTLPLVVPAGQSVDFKMSAWPKAFANFVLKNSDWNSCWALAWWDGGHVNTKVMGNGRQDLDVTAQTDAGPPQVQVITISPRAVVVPIAPSNGKFQIWHQKVELRGKDISLIDGKAPDPNPSPKSRQVLGVDVSGYQGSSPDWQKMAEWVDGAGRRIWFVYSKASEASNASGSFRGHWKQLSKTRFFRGAYHFLRPVRVSVDRKTDPAGWLRAIVDGADAQAHTFLNAYSTAGGWRQYDLPPMIDLEHECASPEDALALFPALVAMVRAFRANFAGVAPFLYMGPSYLQAMRSLARKAYKSVADSVVSGAPGPAHSSFLPAAWCTSFLSGTWDDSVLMPDIAACRYWPAAYSASRGPDDEPPPLTAEAGYTGPWFPKDPPWWVWQWGISDPGITDRSDPDASPPPTTSRSVGVDTTLDQDVWRGTLDDLVTLALRTQWTPT